MQSSIVRRWCGFAACVKVGAVLLLMVLVQPVMAQVSATFENAGVYAGPGAPINATNFVNDIGADFDIEFPSLNGDSLLADLFGGWSHVENFTNNGIMFSSVGFRFDDQVNGHIGSVNFNNSGVIQAGNQGFIDQQIGNTLTYGGYGEVYVLATNIVNSGTIETAIASLMQLTGDSVDLTGGTLQMDTVLDFSSVDPNISVDASSFGVNTNQLNPSTDLTPAAVNLPFPFGTIQNPVPFFNVISNINGTSNTLIQIVFIANVQPNVTPSVFFVPGGIGMDDFIAIQWSGSFIDPVTAGIGSNYLSLVDDISSVVATNMLLPTNPINLFLTLTPTNYSFASSLQPFFTTLTAATNGVPDGFAFDPGFVTNNFSAVAAEVLPTTVPTNLVPGGSLTNLSGRVQISASGTLNVSGVQMSGMNYLSIQSTNQLVNDGLARIFSPYTDIAVGSTNGNLAFTNLLVTQLPQWSGNLFAWSATWQESITNSASSTNSSSSTNGTVATLPMITNIFEVLVVDGDLLPTFNAQQHDVYLYASNNLVVSDDLDITRNFFTSATNLLVTANPEGQGALSFDGELKFDAFNFSWAAATPNLDVFTNFGLVTTVNIATFGSAAKPYLSFDNEGIIDNGGGTKIFADSFQNSGEINSENGAFDIVAQTSFMTNGFLFSGSTLSLTIDNLEIVNQTLDIGQGLTLSSSTSLTDDNVLDGNLWSIGLNYVGFGSVPGFSLLQKPATGDLLGSSITLNAPGAVLNNTWAGVDFGVSTAGFQNNVAIGQLILDSTTNGTHFGKFVFAGTGSANAIYIDDLELVDATANGVNNNFEFTPWLSINTNMMVYFAQALANGSDVSAQIDAASLAGKNHGRLRWVPGFAGMFSSTVVNNSDGSTSTVNAGLAASTTADSNGNGIPNASDPFPFFSTGDVDFNVTYTNSSVPAALLTWHSIPAATNIVYFRTSVLTTNWMTLTNFVDATNVPPVTGWPLTNSVVDPVNDSLPHYYKVAIVPNNANYGQ